MGSGYEAVLAALQERDLLASSWGSGKAARCPGPLHHRGDERPSLSIREGDDGKALLYCHAGCDIREVAEALDLTMSDLFNGTSGGAVVATYIYTDEEGSPLYRVMRLSPKGFFQERWEDGEWKPRLRDTRRVLYNLPALIQGVAEGKTIYIVEGEKDADNLTAEYGVVATTLLGGANKWRDDYAEFFKGARVIVIGDSDEPGRLHVTTLKAKIGTVADSIRACYPAIGKDITEHILAGMNLEQLVPEGTGIDELNPLDWEHYEVPNTEWLYEPYIPKHGRVLAFGPAGSLKSLWAMWVGAKLAEGEKKVAYFSLEMLPSQLVPRLRQLHPNKERFKVFTKLRLGSPEHTNAIVAGLKGYDLIIIDSWSAARAHRGYETNADVAALDTEVFMPIINLTGAALLIIDNTGHSYFTSDGQKKKPEHARGASAKGDKMEVTLWFDRPYEDNNYCTDVAVKKMRLDYKIPKPLRIQTPRDRIEFYEVGDDGVLGQPVWPGLRVLEESVPLDSTIVSSPTPPSTSPSASPDELTPVERRAIARVKDKFKATELED